MRFTQTKTKYRGVLLIPLLVLGGCGSDVDFLADHIIMETTSAFVIEESGEKWIVEKVLYGNEVEVGQRAHCSVLSDSEKKRRVFILRFSDRNSDGLVPLQSEFPLDAEGRLKRHEVTPSQVLDRIVRLKSEP
jgi:hypothetical protein